MDHEQCVRWRRNYYNLLKEYNLLDTVEFLGDPEEMIKAEKCLKKGIKYEWMGPSGIEDTFDIVLQIPSLSGDGFYEVTGKFKRIEDNKYLIKNVDSECKLDHSCKETRFRRKIGNLPGPDHHEIAFVKAVERYLPLFCESQGHEQKKTFGKLYWKADENVTGLFDRLIKKRVPALERKKGIFNYLRGRSRSEYKKS